MEVDRSVFLQQNSSSVGLLPYAKVGDYWTVSDEIVLGFARQAAEEGTFDRVFLDGSITGPEAFLYAMKQPENVPVFFFVGKEPIGVACLTNCQGNRAFGHFLYLKRAWGKFTEQAGRLALDYWFSFRVANAIGDKQLFNVIIGVIPSENVRAIDYVQRIGMTVLGEVPKMVQSGNALKPATVVYMSR